MDECRWGVFGFEYEGEAGRQEKLLLLQWAPDTAMMQMRLAYGTATKALRDSLAGIDLQVQATEESGLLESEVLPRLTGRG